MWSDDVIAAQRARSIKYGKHSVDTINERGWYIGQEPTENLKQIYGIWESNRFQERVRKPKHAYKVSLVKAA